MSHVDCQQDPQGIREVRVLHERLSLFLRKVQDQLQLGNDGKMTLSSPEFLLLLQYYGKSVLLEQQVPVEDNDLDYISIAIVLKQLLS